MASLPSIRCCLNALGSTSRSTRLSRPRRLNLPSLFTRSISQQPPSSSSNDPSLKSSSPVVPSSPPAAQPPSFLTPKPLPPSERIVFNFKFSSITTSETLAALLEIAQSVSPSEVALLPELEKLQRTTALKILSKASKMDLEQRATYFKDVDGGFLSFDGATQSRRQKAKKQVESGLFDREDALTAEEWEDEYRVKGEAGMERKIQVRGLDREKALKERRQDEKRLRRQRLERLELRKEMREAQDAGKEST